MAHRTRRQLANRRRVEAAIGAVAPVLDLLLAGGERISRIAGRHDDEPEPPRRVDPTQHRTALDPRTRRR